MPTRNEDLHGNDHRSFFYHLLQMDSSGASESKARFADNEALPEIGFHVIRRDAGTREVLCGRYRIPPGR